MAASRADRERPITRFSANTDGLTQTLGLERPAAVGIVYQFSSMP
jgi:hypothetical protein